MEVVQYILTLSYVVILGVNKVPLIVAEEDAKILNSHSANLVINCKEDTNEVAYWLCGSSVVNQYLTLTAGHCVFSCMKKSFIIVYVGSVNTLKNARSTAYSYLIHEHYNEPWLTNDIALVRLRTPLILNLNVNRVALMENPPYREEAYLATWGIIDENTAKSTQNLKFIKQYVREVKDCQDLLKGITEGTFCAGGKDPSEFVSEGDSGNALIVRGYIQIGLVSWQSIKSSGTVYTDVGFFYNWIKDNADTIMCQAK